MNLAVVGTGYVGLVSGSCFADSGNHVTCVDIDQEKIDMLKRGQIPIYEPGLTEMVRRTHATGRLQFTTDLASAVTSAEVVFLAVGTPQSKDGAADMTATWEVVDAIAPHLQQQCIVVTKSTVPVGTNARIFRRLRELTGREVHVASNPEFLKEGAAVEDFMKPDRVVVGVRTPQVGERLRLLYRPFLRTENPFLIMSPESAEMTKYAANAMLATKISFINEMANLCERMGGDIDDVRRGIGTDSRIGFAFIFPGAGYGGSCFPKDVRAINSMARDNEFTPRLMAAVDDVNEAQKRVLIEKITAHFEGDLSGKRLAVWGLAFKPRTDDIREAPARVLIDHMLEQGMHISVHDPEALENIRAVYGDKLRYCQMQMDVLDDAHALAICTEWKDYHRPDYDEMRRRMVHPVIFDGRNLYEPAQMKELGFRYYSIGRPSV